MTPEQQRALAGWRYLGLVESVNLRRMRTDIGDDVRLVWDRDELGWGLWVEDTDPPHERGRGGEPPGYTPFGYIALRDLITLLRLYRANRARQGDTWPLHPIDQLIPVLVGQRDQAKLGFPW